MRKLFLGVYNPSIILTYISVFCSIFGIGKLLIYQPYESIDIVAIAMVLLVIAGVCDMFDGRIARLCKRTDKEKEFGIQLDSLADTVSFVVYPAVILLFITGVNITSMIISFFYMFAGIMRLGWFNVTTEENKGFFIGLPVTFSALVFPSLYLILQFVDCGFENIIIQILYTIVALTFILNFKLKKPGLKFSIIMLIYAICLIVSLLVL